MAEITAARGSILIVDDHPEMIGLLLDLFAAAFPAHELRIAGSAREALESCKRDLPALAIVDIGLPQANGIHLAGEIKSLSPGVGVVIHSSYDQDIYRERSIAAGADAFVSKARTYSELIPAVARLLSQQPGLP
jgi:two-component system response regulator YesN